MVKNGRKKSAAAQEEKDSAYFLKIVLYIIAGAFWLRFPEPIIIGSFTLGAFPLGFLVGLLFVSHDKFQIDRKIEYAVLIISAILSVFIGTGIVL